jgi:hypothetical protein
MILNCNMKVTACSHPWVLIVIQVRRKFPAPCGKRMFVIRSLDLVLSMMHPVCTAAPICIMIDLSKYASFVKNFLREGKLKWGWAIYFCLLTIPHELTVTWHAHVTHYVVQLSAIVAVSTLLATRPRRDFTGPTLPRGSKSAVQRSQLCYGTSFELSSLAWAPLFFLQRCMALRWP